MKSRHWLHTSDGSQLDKKVRGRDQQLIHCLGVDPECKHRRRTDTDFTLLIVGQSCLPLGVDQSASTEHSPTDCSTPGFPGHQQVLELAQTHVHWVGEAILPSHPLWSPFLPAFDLSGILSYCSCSSWWWEEFCLCDSRINLFVSSNTPELSLKLEPRKAITLLDPISHICWGATELPCVLCVSLLCLLQRWVS